MIKNKPAASAPDPAPQLPKPENLAPEFLKVCRHDPDKNSTVPYMTGTVGLVGEQDKLKEPQFAALPRSFPKKIRGPDRVS